MAVNKDDVATAAVFKALADPTRRRVLEDLAKGELAAGELASRFPISGPSVSRHLAVLKAAGLVSERRSANRVIYALVGDRLASEVGGFLATVCPKPAPPRHQGKKKVKGAQKNAGKAKHKAELPPEAPLPAPGTVAPRPSPGRDPLTATV